MYFRSVARCSLAGLAFLASAAFAQDANETGAAKRDEHLAPMKAVAQSIRLLADPRQPESAVKLVDKPVLAYTDNTRNWSTRK